MAKRVQITVEIDIPSDQTDRDMTNWIERCFSYYHPRMKAKVLPKPTTIVREEADDLL